MGENKDTQQFIDNLITEILNAEEAESVTNEMVARVMNFVNSQLKDVSTKLQTTIQSVTANTNQISTILGNNATKAIDNLNEIITFLQGFENSDNLASKLKAVSDAVGTVDGKVKAISDSVGEPDGIAPLGHDGIVPGENLPPVEREVRMFAGIVTEVQVKTMSSIKKSTDAGCQVVYTMTGNKFLLKVSGTDPVPVSVPEYYGNWADADDFGEFNASGRKPDASKLYVCTGDNRIYRYDGTGLRPLTEGLFPPVRCVDESDLQAAAEQSGYAEGQQFYIPETD